MRIRHLSISNFRGIKELDWFINGTNICLIGPNNSTKTTILDAIECVLSPKWNLIFSDTDFYQLNPANTIKIVVSVSDIPDKLLKIYNLGGYIWALKADNSFGEPDDKTTDGDCLLRICLTVDRNLEPMWEALGHSDKTRISAADRELLGMSRVNTYVDRDFSWGKNTPLTRITQDDATVNLAEMGRTARDALKTNPLTDLDKVAEEVEKFVKPYGVKIENKLRAGLDPDSTSLGRGNLILHDGEIPVYQYGLGSKRLISIAMQKSITKNGAIVLIDEIEHGLEPYRLCQLVRFIRPFPQKMATNAGYIAQTFFTSHSVSVLMELQVTELYVVRSINGMTSVKQFEKQFQPFMRSSPQAFLSPRIIVCEGPTEVGLLRAVDKLWIENHNGLGMTSNGITLIDGKGSTMTEYAQKLRSLGYEVLIFGDADTDMEQKRDALEKENIKVILWANEAYTEMRLLLDIPIVALKNVFIYLFMEHGEDDLLNSIRDKLKNKLGNIVNLPQPFTKDDLFDLLEEPDREKNIKIREALATIANPSKSKGKGKGTAWFKRTDLAENVGDCFVNELNQVSSSDLAQKFGEIEKWVYGS